MVTWELSRVLFAFDFLVAQRQGIKKSQDFLKRDPDALGLPEYKLKVVNIWKMDGTGGLEVVVLWAVWLISMICKNCKKKW